MHDPIFLAAKSDVATKEDLQVVQDLLDTLMAHRESCVGMAANMIGVRKRIIAFLDESGRAPTKGTTIPKIDPTELMVLDEKQLKIFISAIQSNEQWRDFFYLEIMTGLRRGEICALKWWDFDIVERKLHVNRSVTPHGAIGKAKTCYSERVIKLPYSVHQVLVNRKTSAQSEWMFPQPKDLSKPITGESALRQLKVILKSSGLPNIRFHDLRHTFATHAVSAGIDPKTLSSILGHSKASFSLDRYTAFPFQISHETGYACFRRYLYQHMNMIRAHFCFDDRYFFPFAQFP